MARSPSTSEYKAFAALVEDHVQFFSKFGEEFGTLTDAVKSVGGGLSAYSSSIAGVLGSNMARVGYDASGEGAALAMMATSDVIEQMEAKGVGASLGKDVLGRVGDAVREFKAMLAAYEDIRVGDLINAGVATQEEANPFAADLNYTRLELYHSETLLGLAARWAQVIGKQSKAQEFWNALGTAHSALGTVETTLHAVWARYFPGESLSFATEYASLVTSTKAGLVARVKESRDIAAAQQPTPGWLDTEFNAAVDWIRNAASWGVFGIAGFALTRGPFKLGLDTGAMLSRQAYSGAQVLKASAEAAAAIALAYVQKFAQARVGEGKTTEESRKEAWGAGDEAARTTGAAAFRKANAERDAYENYYREMEDQLKKLKEAAQGPWDDFLAALKWVGIGAGALGVGFVVWKVS